MLDKGNILKSNQKDPKTEHNYGHGMLGQQRSHPAEQSVLVDSLTPRFFPSRSPAPVTWISVVCAADEGYVMPLAAMVVSLLERLSWDCKLQLFVIDGGITPQSREKLTQCIDPLRATIEWLKLSPETIQKVENLKTSGHISISAYYRILIPELLPKQIEKVIYLDCDLIFKGDLQTLWNQEIGDNYLLAVQDMGVGLVSSKDGLLNYRELGLPEQTKYFNSGVLVLNLTKWRATNLSWRTIDYISTQQEFIRFHDQDGLNAVIAGQWGEIHPMWNQTPDIYRNWRNWEESFLPEEIYNRARYSPQIIHFASSEKPWNTALHPNRDLFYHYLDQTPWAGWRFTWWQACLRRSHRVLRKLTRTFQ
jgi:lipopolysaccharide biosynthesis glycosyltransferase